MAKQAPQPNADLKKWLESQGYKVKTVNEWGTKRQPSLVVSAPKAPARGTTVPRDEDYYTAQSQPTSRPWRTTVPRDEDYYTAQSQPTGGGSSPGKGRRAIPQPPLAPAAATKLRGQYASLAQTGGGAFVTDTNTGLLNALQQMGFRPTPLAAWGQMAELLRRRGLLR